MTNGVPCMVMRGGTSKGAYFLRSDLPVDDVERDSLLRRVMGSPDARQIDGIGGAHPLTSKVAIVERSLDGRADVEYLFLQVGVDTDTVSDRQNCGNLLAGVGQFAIERGLVEASGDETSVRIFMQNTQSIAVSTFALDDGSPRYTGDTKISGVPGGAAPVQLTFSDIAGGSCGALLPTGNSVDVIDGVPCTLVDNGMPVVVMRADAVGSTGYEEPSELEANKTFRTRIESIRLQAGELMNLGDVSDTTVPKITLVSPPVAGGALCTRTFIPHRCHDAIGVFGAVSVATAALLDGTPASEVAQLAGTETIGLEHPTGTFDAVLTLADGHPERAGIVRTARKLMDGIVFPREIVLPVEVEAP